MNAVAYCHPFVPPEWIAAHGLRPYWLPCRAGDEPAVWVRRGACPVAAGRIDDFRDELPAEALPAEAVVLTTTCDQIRYAAALLQHQGRLPVFLLDVPRTWQSRSMRTFYGEELGRLGRFLVGLGGTAPGDDALGETMLQYDRARASLRHRRGEMSAGGFAQAINEVRGDLPAEWHVPETGWHTRLAGWHVPELAKGVVCATPPRPSQAQGRATPTSQIDNLPQELRLALVGGPMSPGDYELLTTVEDAGGRFVLDATESGERTLPAPVDIDRLHADPREELVRIYFDCIPEVFQRPNDRLFTWLRAEVAQRCVRGILVRRHVWCDHWHGETARLREELAVPILEWDGAGKDPRAQASAVGRIEAFLEMLRL
jgi:benzoyl-CoA reductase/2-hydroxyglutaryl-CoA dehydratase subunit BcrC/BadD/HgdB